MKKSVLAGLGIAGFIVGVAVLQAVSGSGAKPQTTCPITGEAIDTATSPHVDWQGQRVFFASTAAADTFRQDPEKAFAVFQNEGIELENVETTCPVSGDKLLGGGPTVRYKGRTIRFCCKDCPAKFDLHPETYLGKLPGEQMASR